jgi:hypothetical protein
MCAEPVHWENGLVDTHAAMHEADQPSQTAGSAKRFIVSRHPSARAYSSSSSVASRVLRPAQLARLNERLAGVERIAALHELCDRIRGVVRLLCC